MWKWEETFLIKVETYLIFREKIDEACERKKIMGKSLQQRWRGLNQKYLIF